MFRKSLSAIRALGKAGYSVHVLGESRLTVGSWSRFTARRILTPDAKDDPERFGAALTRHLQDLQRAFPAAPRPVLLPMEDATLRYVIGHADPLAALADFIVPDSEAFGISSDKAATMGLAARTDVPYPRTETVDSADALVAAIERLSPTPCIVKPATGSGARGVRYNPSFTPDQAETYIATFGPAVVQERIPPEGEAFGVSVLFGRDHSCLAHFCHKRLQQFPNSGGPSSDRIGIEDAHLLEMSLRLLTALHWTGIAMVEWKVDPASGTPMLLEINPRFWGSLELAVRSGVDFPVLYARAAAGHPQAPPVPTLGVRCRWLIPGDTLRWLTAEKHSRESLWAFCQGLPWLAEEWDSQDLRGCASSILCQALSALRPKYRKLLQR